MKPGFNPTSEEPPLRFEISVSAVEDDSSSTFCSDCGILDPRKEHKKIMTVDFQSGKHGLTRLAFSPSKGLPHRLVQRKPQKH